MADELRFGINVDGADKAAKDLAAVQKQAEALEGSKVNVEVVASDDATKTLDDITKSVDSLDGADASVEVAADDQASETLDDVTGTVDDLDGAQADVAVAADGDDAVSTLDDVQTGVDDLDGATAEVSIDASDDATSTVDDVQGAVDSLDGSSAEVTLEADDQASPAIDDVGGSLGGLGDALGKLPGPLGEVGGLLSKLGAGGATAAGGIAAVAAGVGVLALKGVQQFQDLGIAVSNFVTKTGASADAASRLIEVGDDLSISTETLEKSIGKMLLAVQKTPGAFDAIGAAIVRNKDGTLDSAATFANVVGALNAIPDAGKRAEAGAAIFGRAWMSMSELVGMSADDLQKRLASVSDEKLFDQSKIDEAKGLRDAFDAISDAADDLFLSIGRQLAPAIAKLAPAIGKAVDALGPFVDGLADSLGPAIEGLVPLLEQFSFQMQLISKLNLTAPDGKSWSIFGGALQQTTGAFGVLKDAITGSGRPLEGELNPALLASAQAATDMGDGLDAAAEATKAAEDAATAYEESLKGQASALQESIDKQNELVGTMQSYADLTLELPELADKFTESLANYNATLADSEATQADQEQALRDSVRAADALAQGVVKTTEAQNTMNGVTTTATQKVDLQNQSLLAQARTAEGPARTAILNYIGSLNGIPPEKLTEIQAAVDAGDLALAQSLLDGASKTRTAAYSADVNDKTLATTNAQLDAAARERTVTYQIQVAGMSALLAANRAALLAKTGGTAAGTAVVPAAATLGAEDDESVAPAAAYDPVNGYAGGGVTSPTRRRVAPVTNNITNNIIVPRIPSGRELARVSDRWSRINGGG